MTSHQEHATPLQHDAAPVPAIETQKQATATLDSDILVKHKYPIAQIAMVIFAAITALMLIMGWRLMQRFDTLQENLVRQSASSSAEATLAHDSAQKSQEIANAAVSRISVLETRLSEATLQRSQLEALMNSLSNSRDENLVVDLEAGIRLAQQQAELTGSVAPLLAALQTATERIERAAQPRLTPLQHAIKRDTDRIKAASVTDIPALLARMDDLTRRIDELPLFIESNSQPATVPPSIQKSTKTNHSTKNVALDTPNNNATPIAATWWRTTWQQIGKGVSTEARNLLRISKIDSPDAALVAPDQAFFIRENLKLKLLNARLGVLARQHTSANLDLQAIAVTLKKYFDTASPSTKAALNMLQITQEQMKAVRIPRADETLSALATAATGR